MTALTGVSGNRAYAANAGAAPEADARNARKDLVDQLNRATVEDRVELSVTATAEEFDPATLEKIRRVRQEIAAGTYVTPEKIDRVVDRLHAEFGG
jgi:uncharacterized protein YpuA (DUF1002 family)